MKRGGQKGNAIVGQVSMTDPMVQLTPALPEDCNGRYEGQSEDRRFQQKFQPAANGHITLNVSNVRCALFFLRFFDLT